MWHSTIEPLARACVIQFRATEGGAPLPYAEVIRLWQEDPVFRTFTTSTLADLPYGAFRWEMPAVSTANSTRPFEFAVLDCPELECSPDPSAFREHFARAGAAHSELIAEFPNLGQDAILIVPQPIGEISSYGHFAAFLRRAPRVQIQALWARVGNAMHRRLGARPVWLNTAGLGVPWLHVRLDDRPKYYGHQPYRAAAES